MPKKLKMGTMEAHHTSNPRTYLEVKCQSSRSPAWPKNVLLNRSWRDTLL